MNLWYDRRLRINLTRLGIQYLVALLAVGAFAVNSGNNLIYLLFSLMLGLFLLSGWVSRRALRDLDLEALEEGNLFARVRGGVLLRFREGAPGRTRALELRLALEGGTSEPGFLPGGAEPRPLAVVQVRPGPRGPARVTGLELRTGFPFGFLEKAWVLPLDREVLVLPHPRASRTPPGPGDHVLDPRLRKGTSTPEGVRPFRAGDPVSHVHWKRTAQRGEPWVRTFEDEEPRGLHLRLDLRAWAPGEAFERELERMSGAILRARLMRQDASLDLSGPDGMRRHCGYRPCWRALALAQAQGGAERMPHGGGAVDAMDVTCPSP